MDSHDQQPQQERPLELLTRIGGRMSRRDVLKRAVALGLGAPVIASLLAACGGNNGAQTTAPATSRTGGGASPTSAGTTSAATPTKATGGATQPPSSAGAGGTFVIGRNLDDLITFDPGIVYEISSSPIMYAVYGTLVFQDPNDLTKFVPMIASEVPTAQNGGISADGLQYTFKLRQGVKFHTGNEMKAADWVFSMRRLHFLRKNPAFLADPFVKANKDDPTKDQVMVEAVDDYTVRFTLVEPNAAFLAYMASLNNTVLDSTFLKGKGALDTPDAETKDTAQEFLNQNSAGVGPYKLTSFKNKEEVVLERFADYYGDKPAYEKVVFKYIVDSGTALQQLEGGAIQLAMELDAEAIKSLNKANFDVAEGNSLNHAYLALHNDPTVGGPLADIKVRQAIAQAIDYDAFVNNLRGGAAVRPATAVPLGLLGADKVEPDKWVRNVEAAKALIAEAGVGGQEITFTYGSGSSYDGVSNETIAAKLQADIEAIGLKVRLNPMEAQQRLQDYRDAKLQFTVSTWSPDYVDVHTYAYPFGGVAGQAPSKRVAYVNETNTKLLGDGIKELDPAKREQIYVQIQQNMRTDATFPILWQPVFQYAMQKGIAGVRIHPVALLIVPELAPA